MGEIAVDGNGELSGAFGFDPADELNQQIADQNARAAQIEAIGDPQFAALALSGLRQEADEAFALMASEPYEELGARGLEDEREAVTAETILQEVTAEVETETTQLVRQVEAVSPRSAEAARRLAAERIADDPRLIEARTLRDEAVRQRNQTNELIARLGKAWLVPEVLRREAVARAGAAASTEAAAPGTASLEAAPKEVQIPDWDPDFREAVHGVLDTLAEQGLLQVAEADGRAIFAEVTLIVIRARSQSKIMGTQTAMERLAQAGIVPKNLANEENPAIPVSTMIAMALLNSNRAILGKGARSKQTYALNLINELVDKRLQEAVQAARRQSRASGNQARDKNA